MAQQSDVKMGALERALLQAAQINDLERLWLVDRIETLAGEPYTGATGLADLWNEMLDLEGIEPKGASLSDRKREFFSRATGLSTARPDVELAYWQMLA